jgi:outer membrane protein OmpA-like peptidoglycan-associated protein
MKRELEGIIFLFAIFFVFCCVFVSCTPKPKPPSPLATEKVNGQPADVGRGRGHKLSDMGFSRALSTAFIPIQFAYNSARIPEDQKNLLSLIAEDAQGKARCTVTGHTCPLGSDAYNHALARDRAEAVVLSLRMRGVTTDLQALSAGEDSLIATEPGEYWRNRRAVVECWH